MLRTLPESMLSHRSTSPSEAQMESLYLQYIKIISFGEDSGHSTVLKYFTSHSQSHHHSHKQGCIVCFCRRCLVGFLKKYDVHQGNKAAQFAVYNRYNMHSQAGVVSSWENTDSWLKKRARCKVQEIPEIGTCDTTSARAQAAKMWKKTTHLWVTGHQNSSAMVVAKRSGNETVFLVLHEGKTSQLQLPPPLFFYFARYHLVVYTNRQPRNRGARLWMLNYCSCVYTILVVADGTATMSFFFTCAAAVVAVWFISHKICHTSVLKEFPK